MKLRWEYLQAILGATCMALFSLTFGHSAANEGTTGRKGEVRLAYFPNLTHAPALIAVENGTFQRDIPGYGFSTKVVNAGPDAMEALLAGSIDMAYVGPSPALNTYIRSHGEALRIVGGVCSGGALLMARPDAGIHSVADLSGKKVAVPELGGTQDVSLRHFMQLAGLSAATNGGTVDILPLKNPDILTLFKQGQLDAAWVPEPWASRLAIEAGAQQAIDERDLWPNHRFTTTVLVASQKFIAGHPDAVAGMLKANAETIAEIQAHPEASKDEANVAIGKLTGKKLKDKVLNLAWGHLTFDAELDKSNLLAFTSAARDAGYVKVDPTYALGICAEPNREGRMAANP